MCVRSIPSLQTQEIVVMFKSIRTPLQRLDDKITQARASWEQPLEAASQTLDDPLAQLQLWVMSSALTHVLTQHLLAPLPEPLRDWMSPALGASFDDVWSPEGQDPMMRLMGWLTRQREENQSMLVGSTEPSPIVVEPGVEALNKAEPVQGTDGVADVLLRALGARPLSGAARRQSIALLAKVLASSSLSATVQGDLEQLLNVLVHGD